MRTFSSACLQRHRDTGERAAGADRAGEAVDLAVGLAPDFRPGGFDVALAVGDIVELVRPDRAVVLGLRQLLGEPPGNLHVVIGVGVGDRRHLDQLRAAQAQHVLLLLALRLRDDDDGAKPHGIANQGEADAGIAGGALDDHAARPQRALAHRVLDDEQGGAVLHRLPRIHEFGLPENGAAGRLGGALEGDQRRIADGPDNSVANLHWPIRWVRREPTVKDGPRPDKVSGRPTDKGREGHLVARQAQAFVRTQGNFARLLKPWPCFQRRRIRVFTDFLLP